MSKSKNNNNNLKSVPATPITIINHSLNSKLLATLINNNDLIGLSTFILELCKEPNLYFEDYQNEWLCIFIKNIKKDLNLTIHIAKALYFHPSCNISTDNIFKASQVLAEYVWKDSSEFYKSDCIFLMDMTLFNKHAGMSNLELQQFYDSKINLIDWLSIAQKSYREKCLKPIVSKKKLQINVANF